MASYRLVMEINNHVSPTCALCLIRDPTEIEVMPLMHFTVIAALCHKDEQKGECDYSFVPRCTLPSISTLITFWRQTEKSSAGWSHISKHHSDLQANQRYCVLIWGGCLDLYFLGFVLRQLILRKGLGATVETARRRWAWSPTLGSEENTAQTEPFSKPAVFEWQLCLSGRWTLLQACRLAVRCRGVMICTGRALLVINISVGIPVSWLWFWLLWLRWGRKCGGFGPAGWLTWCKSGPDNNFGGLIEVPQNPESYRPAWLCPFRCPPRE